MVDDLRPPKIENAPGIGWRKHKHRWEARWVARSDLVKKGYPIAAWRVWIGELGPNSPNLHEIGRIQQLCNAMQDEMQAWSLRHLVAPAVTFNGTVSSLIQCYKADKLSRYNKARFVTRRNYDSLLKSLDQHMGKFALGEIKARQIHECYEAFAQEGHITMAHSVLGMLRGICSYGVAFQDSAECLRLCTILKELRFANGAPRTERLTVEQVNMIRKRAHATNQPSIALANAFQFFCILRQKDVIGEYIPISEPVPSAYVYGNDKWVRGLDWNEIDADFVLRHTTSKRSKPIVIPLRKAPEVMEELAVMAGSTPELLARDMFPASGPIVLREKDGQPWPAYAFRVQWRKLADACDIPKHIRNMDSRAGGISEAVEAEAPIEHIRHAATHSDVATTTRYSRAGESNVVSVMDKRAEFRNKKGAS